MTSVFSARPALAACFALAAASVATPAAAQVKTDSLWRGTAGLAAAYTSGNSETSSLALTADFARARPIDKIALGGSYNYARSRANTVRTTTADKWTLQSQYDYNLTPRSYVFGQLGGEGDQLIDLNWRASLAGGAGYKLIDTDQNSLNLFGGVGYSRDRYDSVQRINGRTGTTFSRTSLLIGEESSHQLTDTTSFKQRLEFSPGISGDKAQLARFTANLSVSMTRALALTVGIVDTYNSKPGVGKKENDFSVLTGISVKLGAP